MKVFGITGGIGAGKTQILEYLNDKYGATICQADKVAKKLQKKGEACYDEIVNLFGEEILDDKEEIDREKLAEIVFSNKELLEKLNKIVHPAVKVEIKKKIAREEKKHTNLFMLEGAVLIEDNYDEICDELWYVYVNAENRKKRLVFARGYSEEKVEKIFSVQLPKETFLKNCDRVIDNNGLFDETKLQIDRMVKEFI